MVDNKPLVQWSGKKTIATIQRLDRPLYDGEMIYKKNPFSIVGYGFTEFMLMKTALREWHPCQVLEIKDVIISIKGVHITNPSPVRIC